MAGLFVIASSAFGQPAITSITPSSGPTKGGNFLRLQGTGLAPGSVVVVGSRAGTVLAALGSEMYVLCPAGDGSNSHAISYAPPVITSVIGGPTGNTIPSSDGTIITIFGDNFGAVGNKLFVGGLSMNGVLHDPASPHTKLIATAPPGFGRGHPVMTLVGDQVAYFSSLMHYDMPVCAGDADGDGLVDFDDITSWLANWSSSCP